MPSHRSPARPVRGRRALLVAGLTAAAVLVPSAAWAETLPAITCPAGQVLSQVDGGATPSCDTSPGSPSDQNNQGATPATTTSAAPTSLPPLDLSQLNALLAQAGISTACSTSVEADVQQALADIPATAAALLEEILDQLGGGLPTSPLPLTDPASGEKVLMTLVQDGPTAVPHLSASDPAELLLVKDIQQLITDLLTKCVPAPPTTLPTPTTSAAPVPSEAPQTTQPVSYLGYAPTGGSGPGSGSGSPALAVLGGGLLLAGGAGATWYGVRSRAARAKG